MKFAKGPLLRLANQICREHGKATGQKIPVAVFLATGTWMTRPNAWLWLIEESERRGGKKMGKPAKAKTGGRARPLQVRVKKDRLFCVSPDFTSSPEWRKLRFEALKGSNGGCSLCGRSNREHGVILHVDHIKPKSLFPHLALTLSNLQVLCEDCNMGKGNRDDTAWRTAPETERTLDAIDWKAV